MALPSAIIAVTDEEILSKQENSDVDIYNIELGQEDTSDYLPAFTSDHGFSQVDYHRKFTIFSRGEDCSIGQVELCHSQPRNRIFISYISSTKEMSTYLTVCHLNSPQWKSHDLSRSHPPGRRSRMHRQERPSCNLKLQLLRLHYPAMRQGNKKGSITLRTKLKFPLTRYGLTAFTKAPIKAGVWSTEPTAQSASWIS